MWVPVFFFYKLQENNSIIQQIGSRMINTEYHASLVFTTDVFNKLGIIYVFSFCGDTIFTICNILFFFNLKLRHDVLISRLPREIPHLYLGRKEVILHHFYLVVFYDLYLEV